MTFYYQLRCNVLFFVSDITQCVYLSEAEGGRRGKKFTENYKEKHTIDAMYGWYCYDFISTDKRMYDII